MKPTRNGVNGAQKLNNLEVARDQDLPLLAQQRPSSISPTVNETHFNYMMHHKPGENSRLGDTTLKQVIAQLAENRQKTITEGLPISFAKVLG